MLAKVFSGAVLGVDAYPVEIEVNAGHGEPQTVIVGLPDVAVKESKDRVATALINSGFKPPKGRTTINLAPADVKKEGPSFDLPIALGTIAALEDLDAAQLAGYCIAGELALSGEVRRIRGVLPLALLARAAGCRGVLIPADNADEAAVVDGLAVYPVTTLRQAADFLAGLLVIPPYHIDVAQVFAAILGTVKSRTASRNEFSRGLKGGTPGPILGRRLRPVKETSAPPDTAGAA